MANTCNYKLIENVHIGVGIRMTADKNTLPFKNEPLTNMKIINYGKNGYTLVHEKLPKQIFINWDQVPLLDLTIDKGVIKDELTFVENIVVHQMELIKTDNSEYLELLEEEKKLKEINKISISQAIPGEIYIGAQCKEGIPMIYLGSFYYKNIIPERDYKQNDLWKRNPNMKFYLDKKSPKHAFFLIETPNNLSYKEEKEIKSSEYYKGKENNWKEQQNYFQKQSKEYLIKNNKSRYKIVSFSVTSKRIKELIPQNLINHEFKDIEFNKQFILDFKYPSFVLKNAMYRNKEYSTFYYNDNYKPIEINFILINYSWDLKEYIYMQEEKKNINENAIKYIKDVFNINVLNPK